MGAEAGDGAMAVAVVPVVAIIPVAVGVGYISERGVGSMPAVRASISIWA